MEGDEVVAGPRVGHREGAAAGAEAAAGDSQATNAKEVNRVCLEREIWTLK